MYEIEQCFKLLKVCNDFRYFVRKHFKDIYISLCFCSELYWFSKTWSLFHRMIDCIEKCYQKNDIKLLFHNFSLFVISLHFFLCKKVSKYCKICSRVRNHNYDRKRLFVDVIYEECDKNERLGLSGKMIDFDVYLQRWECYNYTIPSSAPTDCDYREQINYAQDIFLNFLSVMIRVIINSCYDFFFK